MRGLILKESLADAGVLNLVHITRKETWQVSNAASYQPKVWTALTFEANDDQADDIARQLSQALKEQAWFINASTERHVFIIFPGKVMKYKKGNRTAREKAARYALSIGVPESQLDWDE